MWESIDLRKITRVAFNEYVVKANDAERLATKIMLFIVDPRLPYNPGFVLNYERKMKQYSDILSVLHIVAPDYIADFGRAVDERVESLLKKSDMLFDACERSAAYLPPFVESLARLHVAHDISNILAEFGSPPTKKEGEI